MTAVHAAVATFEAERAERLRRARFETLAWVVGGSLILALSLHASGVFGFRADEATLQRIGGFMDRLTPDLDPALLWADKRTPGSLAYWYYDLPRWLAAIWQTIQMAVLGTALGAALAFVASFFAARTTAPSQLLRVALRRLFDIQRTIPDLILAMLLAAAFAIGPTAGVLTLIVSTMGSLGKLFSEVLENASPGPVEAIHAAGGGWVGQMRFGVLPQVLPNMVSYTLLRLEINLALAAALGLVGAGGIGVELQRAISYTEFDTYLAILLLFVCIICALDLVSGALRQRLTKGRGRA